MYATPLQFLHDLFSIAYEFSEKFIAAMNLTLTDVLSLSPDPTFLEWFKPIVNSLLSLIGLEDVVLWEWLVGGGLVAVLIVTIVKWLLQIVDSINPIG